VISRRRALIGGIACLVILAGDAVARGPLVLDGWEEITRARVDEHGRVAYRSIALFDGERLGNALASLAAADLAGRSRDEIVAFWLNAYNLAVVAAVVNGERPETLRGRARLYSWYRVDVAGTPRTIDSIGAELVRFAAEDPHVRLALCNGTRGGPRLAAKPYEPATLARELAGSARAFVRDPLRNRIDAEPPALSPVFRWYRSEFERQAGTLIAYVAALAPRAARPRLLEPPGREPEFLPFDWRLNAAPGEEPESKPVRATTARLAR
jgi:hypothetical protein